MAPAVLLDGLAQLAAGTAPRIPQDESLVTYIGKLERQHGVIDWSWPAAKIARRVRAFDPWPGTSTTLPATPAPRTIKLFPPLAIDSQTAAAAPGTILTADHRGVQIACGDGALWLAEVQADGSRRMSAGGFVTGHRLQPGTILGQS
jgi:methionyl-tRNA formyltransferase